MSTKSTSNAIEPKVVRYDYAYESSSKNTNSGYKSSYKKVANNLEIENIN
jgi:hypothetical protein